MITILFSMLLTINLWMIVMLLKIIKFDTDAPVLLDNINFFVPSRNFRRNFRRYHRFYIPICHTHYLKNNPLQKIVKLDNDDPYFLTRIIYTIIIFVIK